MEGNNENSDMITLTKIESKSEIWYLTVSETIISLCTDAQKHEMSYLYNSFASMTTALVFVVSFRLLLSCSIFKSRPLSFFLSAI